MDTYDRKTIYHNLMAENVNITNIIFLIFHNSSSKIQNIKKFQ